MEGEGFVEGVQGEGFVEDVQDEGFVEDVEGVSVGMASRLLFFGDKYSLGLFLKVVFFPGTGFFLLKVFGTAPELLQKSFLREDGAVHKHRMFYFLP